MKPFSSRQVSIQVTFLVENDYRKTFAVVSWASRKDATDWLSNVFPMHLDWRLRALKFQSSALKARGTMGEKKVQFGTCQVDHLNDIWAPLGGALSHFLVPVCREVSNKSWEWIVSYLSFPGEARGERVLVDNVILVALRIRCGTLKNALNSLQSQPSVGWGWWGSSLRSRESA